MVKKSLLEVYILIFIVIQSAFIAFGGLVWRGCCSKWSLSAFKLGSAKTSFHGGWCGGNGSKRMLNGLYRALTKDFTKKEPDSRRKENQSSRSLSI